MPVVDADAHVVESDRTWDFLDPSDQKYRPELVHPKGQQRAQWLIDGKLRGNPLPAITDDQFTSLSEQAGRVMVTARETRELEDVAGRLRHMDELGIDVQVMYPTVFIQEVGKPEVEVALCKAYNRWLADIWAQGKGRLRWACALPLQTMDQALEQLEYSQQHGACAVFMRSIEGDRLVADPYFYPLFEQAARLNMTIGVHVANSNPWLVDLLRDWRGSGFWTFRLTTVGAFHELMMSEVPELFPTLRFGFLEAAAQWLPYALKDLRRRMLARNGQRLPDNPLKERRVWVSCQTDDDVPYILKYAGEDNIVIGTDYGHTDQSTDIEALKILRENGELAPAAYRKITEDNPRALYGL